MGTSQAGGSQSIKVLQLTDTHIFESSSGNLLGVDTYESLRDVIDLALKVRGVPDFVLLTGDLSQDETAGSYRRLAELVSRIAAPAYFLPGNHDKPALMAEILPDAGPTIKADRSILWGNWQVILLNSAVEGRVEGRLAAPELDRLTASLEENPDHHTLVCLHHNPVAVGSEWMDRIGLLNDAEFFAVVDRYPQVRGVLWGHVHQEYQSVRGAVALIATPSTCVQFKPYDDDFGLDEKPPGFRWLELAVDGKIETAVVRLASLPRGLDLAATGY